ncbi:MAG: PQQ-dependent sugar dehydrogenase [Akkermansiaceae bacterium]
MPSTPVKGLWFLLLACPAHAVEDDSVILGVGDEILIPVLRNDGDVVDETIAIADAPAHGVVRLSNGGIHYAHNGSGTGIDQFTYLVEDLSGKPGVATVDLSITDEARIPATTLAFPPKAPVGTFSAEIAYPYFRIQSPTALASPPGESKRLFVTQLIGRVLLIPDASDPASTFVRSLELKLLVDSRPNESFQASGGRGLLSLAFHPEFSENGQLFVSYTVLINGITYQRLSRFLMSKTSPDLVDPESETVFIEIEQTGSPNSHTGGDLHFGPDGYLYMSWGDEGGDNDFHGNAQKVNRDFWSSIMRVDVDKQPGNVEPNPHPAIKLDDTGKAYYSVPADNPFFTPPITPDDVRTEFFAIGFRNPWRFSFDKQTGRMVVGDVGQNAREEVSFVNKGDNHGWPYFEGDVSGPKPVPDGNSSEFISPTFVYSHTPRGSVTGGLVYRGDRIPSLYGKYVFCDYVNGDIWAMDLDAGASSLERLTGEAGIVSIGVDPSNNDILFVDYNDRLIRRLVVSEPERTIPETLSETGLFEDLSTLNPNPGLFRYPVNLPFWSDHAIKQRWFALPEGTGTIGFNKDQPWTYPAGMVWVKHFDLETKRGDPETRKRIETRVFVKTEDSAYGVSYRWNEEGTEARLVGEEGVEWELEVEEEGRSLAQRWRIPSRAQCMSCHNSKAGSALSFNTKQLNLQGELSGSTGNFIELLESHGFLTGLSGQVATMPRYVRANETSFSLGARARSYLDVNCSVCHQLDGNSPVVFDTRSHLALAATGMMNGIPTRESFHPDDRLIVPGQPDHSIIFNRLTGAQGYSRMPPFGSTVVDEEGAGLLREWIEQELSDYQTYDEWRVLHFGSSTSSAGSPAFDFDRDGGDNFFEFLTKTDPSSNLDRFSLTIRSQEGMLMIDRPELPHRRVVVESSTDLVVWEPWNVPENNGIPSSHSGSGKWKGPISGTERFFRLKISED